MKLPSSSQQRWAMEWPAWGILSGSSSYAHQSSHHSCTSAHLHTDLCLPTPFFPTPPWYSLIPHVLPCPIALSLHGLSLLLALFQILLLFSLFPSPYSNSSHSSFPMTLFCFSTPHFLLTLSPFRCRLLRIVLLLWSDCPRAGLFATTTLSRSWNSVATTAWLGLALAATCAFYVVFASPSQDKLSGIWGGCSFTFHQVSLLLPMRSHCLRVYLALDFSQNSISYEIPNSRPTIKTPFHILHFLVTCTLALA